VLRINVAPSGSSAIVKMAGKIESEDGPSAFTFMTEVILDDYNRVLLDLSECENMDSTFMGMLLLVQEKYVRDDADFCLINVSKQSMEALKLLGIPKMVPIKKLALEESPEWAEIDLTAFRREEDRMEIVKMAHQALAAANQQNAKRFGSFLRLLKAEMSES
jgi:anti-sigma B factor antagonist